MIKRKNLLLINIAFAAVPNSALSLNEGINGFHLQDANTSNKQSRLLEEVIVTAQKRKESAQDVPISIQAFSSEKMDALGLETTDDLGIAVPSLQFTGVAGFTLIFMRGIGTDNFIPSADPSVATYVDGIYVPVLQNVNSLGNVERVEVLKGPQGTLFGRNATGGAINMITSDPSEAFKAKLGLEFRNYDAKKLTVGISGTVTDWLSASFDGLHSSQSNYYSAERYETDDDEMDFGRIKLNFHSSENFEVSLTAFKGRQRTLGSLIGNNTDPSLIGGALGISPSEDDYSSDMDFEPGSLLEQSLYYGVLSWRLTAIDIKVLASDQLTVQKFASTDFDGSAMPIAAFDTTNEFADYQTAEIQFLSNETTPWSEKFEWVGGLYYLKSEAGFDPAHLRVSPNGLNTIFQTAGISAPKELTDLMSSLPLGNTPIDRQGTSLELRGVMATESHSAFIHGTYFLNSWLNLSLGARVQEEERYLTKASTSLDNPVGGGATTLLDFTLPKKEKSKDISPKTVITWLPAEDMMIYLSYSVGYKSGTFNIINIYTPPNYIVPEQVSTFEIGSKLTLLDGTLTINSAIYHNEIDNLQSGFVSIQSGGAVRFQTAGAAKTKGAETDFIWQPMPNANPGLVLTGNVGYVDAVYTSFKEGSGFDSDTGVYAENQDFSGNKIVRTPEWSGGLGFVQSLYLGDGELEIGADAYYNSGFYYDALNSVEEDSYALLNARIGYYYQPWQLRVTAFGKNLNDEPYHFVQFQTDFGISKTLAPPVEYGLRINWAY